MEGEVKTLLLEGRKKKEISCRWKGVSGRRNEDFITGREHKKSMPVGGGWAKKRETLLPGGNTKSHCRCEWGWVWGGKCEDFVTGRWPRSRNIKSESKVWKHTGIWQGKNYTTREFPNECKYKHFVLVPISDPNFAKVHLHGFYGSLNVWWSKSYTKSHSFEVQLFVIWKAKFQLCIVANNIASRCV